MEGSDGGGSVRKMEMESEDNLWVDGGDRVRWWALHW